jgi:hypothetical protein
MCDDRRRPTRERLLPRPHWTALYTILILGASSAVTVEVFSPAGVARTALRWGVVIGSSMALAFWVRQNRVSLDAEDWCPCAHEKMTVTVMRSAQPAVHHGVLAEANRPAYIGEQPDPEQHEILAR